MSAKDNINSAFTTRLTPINKNERPINPFASKGTPTAQTFFKELGVRGQVDIDKNMDCFQGHCYHAKNDDSVRLDNYSIKQNPKASIQKHAVTRINQEHTRER